ncbi:MAG: alpha/beta fold hydrolase [Anaerolineae bacterium]|nr:alpha/beta fold hydrolase [Anaerolineae bacterium]
MRKDNSTIVKPFILIIMSVTVLNVVIQFSAQAQDQNDSYKISAMPCPVAPALIEIEGETLICGTVTVPENYGEPDGNQVDLVFAVLKSTSLSPASDPVIYLHGGPGAAELRNLAKMTERFAPIRQTRDVIIFDQRGTGYSNQNLTCEVEYATQQETMREFVQTYNQSGGAVPEEFGVNYKIFEICLERFDEIDTDLTQYNTLNNARDVVNLVSALGYDEYNLYGFSYGTQVALEVMRRQPEGLRSVILDSVAPADIKLYENFGQPNVEAVTSLFDICANDEDCNAAYPDLQDRFEALLAQLNEQPIQTTDGSLVTASTVIAALRQNDIRPGAGAYFPLMIWELEQGQTDTLEAIQNYELPPLPPANADPLAARYEAIALSAEAQRLIDEALALRDEARQRNKEADSLLRQGEEVVELDQFDNALAGRFDLLFHEIMNAEQFDRQLALNQAYLQMPLQATSVDDLQKFVTRHFTGRDADRLLALTEEMTDDDVEELSRIIFGKARDYAYFFDVSLALSLYICQEHIPYNTITGAIESFEALAIPQLGTGKLATVQQLIAYCQLFPTGLEPESFHEPVASDIPTLLLLGTADTQTAISWGRHAAETLSQSQVVLFPETGHGAFRYSQCARDIGAAFFNNPEADLNTGCTDKLLPQFVLPPE